MNWNHSANTSLETIVIRPLQVYLRRKITTIKPTHSQESKPRLDNSFIFPSTSNVDNDLDLPIPFRNIFYHYLCHLITSPNPTKILTHLYNKTTPQNLFEALNNEN